MVADARLGAATVDRPDSLVLVDKLVADIESRDQSANSAETSNDSSVIAELEATNSRPNRLGAIYGQDATLRDRRPTRMF